MRLDLIYYPDGKLKGFEFEHDQQLLIEVRALLMELTSLGEQLMSAISDYKTAVDAHLARIGTSVDGLTQDIKTLNDKITEINNNPGPISPEDQKLLDDSLTTLKGVADKLEALDSLTPPPAPPVP